jgi:curved DNA-binding protein CbpA
MTTPIDERAAREALCLPADATLVQSHVRTAYRRRARETHPDVNDGEDAEFKLVTAAAEYLRSELDREGGELPPLAAKPPPRGPNFSGATADVAEMLRKARTLFDDQVDVSEWAQANAERTRREHAERYAGRHGPSANIWDPVNGHRPADDLRTARLSANDEGHVVVENVPPGARVVFNVRTAGVRIESADGKPLPIKIDIAGMMNDLFPG